MGFGPEFFFRLRRIAEQVTPVGVENVVELEHGHVAADAVAVGGDGAEVLQLRGAKAGMEMIELGYVLPGREVGIFCQRGVTRTLRCGLSVVERRIFLKFFLGCLDVIFRAFAHPGMIERGVVADEIQE